mgnify:CR=1 FL=1
MKKYFKSEIVVILILTIVVSTIIYLITLLSKNGLNKNNKDSNKIGIQEPIISEATTVKVPKDWQTFTNSEITFMHPSNVGKSDNTKNTVGGGEIVKISFMGETQKQSGRTQTELLDGFIFIVSKLAENSNKTPLLLATNKKENSVTECGVFKDSSVSNIEKINLPNLSGYKYTVTNCRGNYTSNFVSNGNYIYEITQFYTGFNNEDIVKYKNITNEIIQTLKFGN